MATRALRTPPAPTGPVPRAGGGKSSSLLDTRAIYCGDDWTKGLEQLAKPALSLSNALPDRCIDLIYIDPPFDSNRNDEVFWGETQRVLHWRSGC